MRIGIDIRPLMDRHYSGVSWYTLNLVKALLETDKENEYCLFYNSFFKPGRIVKFDFPNARLFRCRYPNKLLNFLFKFFNWPKIDRLLNVDIFLMPNLNFIALSEDCQSLLTIHDLSFFKYPEFFTVKRRLWHWFVAADKLAESFSKIIAVSENTKSDIISLLKINPKKIEVIYPGINKELGKINLEGSVSDFIFSDSNKAESIIPEIKSVLKIKRKYDLPKKFILFLGTLEPRKNIIGLLKAFSLFRKQNSSDYKLVIAGARGWKSKKIFKEIISSEHKKDIIILDYIDEFDKVILYNLTKCFVFPSFYEGFGFPALEAIACGTPTVASYSSSLGEVVGSSAILADPYEYKELASAISIALKKDKQELITNGLLVKEKFNWSKTAVAYLDIMKK